MLNGKDLAQLLRKSRKLVIERIGDGEYIVTDTYIMVRLIGEEFTDFFIKYNSYKSTVNIPFQFEGTIASIGDKRFSEDRLNTKIIINQFEDAKYKVELTDYSKTLNSKREARLFKVGNDLGMFNRKYDFLLELGDEYKSSNKKSPLFIIQDDTVKAVIMPIVDRKADLKEEILEICQSWDESSKTA